MKTLKDRFDIYDVIGSQVPVQIITTHERVWPWYTGAFTGIVLTVMGALLMMTNGLVIWGLVLLVTGYVVSGILASEGDETREAKSAITNRVEKLQKELLRWRSVHPDLSWDAEMREGEMVITITNPPPRPAEWDRPHDPEVDCWMCGSRGQGGVAGSGTWCLACGTLH